MSRLFGTSGVRGLWGERASPSLFLELGKALAVHLGNSGRVLVGRDTRTSGEALQAALVSGLLAGGCKVIQVGVVPTPVLAFCTKLLGADAGAIVTASHNPPQYNGVKFWSADGMAFTPEEERKIEDLVEKNPKGVEWSKVGETGEANILPVYSQEILSHFSLERSFRVVVDCGNGAASLLAPHLLRELGCEVISLHSHPSGFPGRELEPVPSNLRHLEEGVKQWRADLGIAYDGDADRVVAVDEKGRTVEGDKLLALVAGQETKKGDTMVTTVDASRVIEDVVESRGGRVVRTKVGDVSVALACREHRASFGGEECGAWIFPKIHLAPDGILGSVILLKILESGKSLSQLWEELPKYVVRREKVSCPENEKAEKMERILQKAEKMGGEVSTVDGVRISMPEGWALVRPSGTEPLIRVTVEGKEEKWIRETMEKIVRILATK